MNLSALTASFVVAIACFLCPELNAANQDAFLDVKGVKIHYTVHGNGDPVVLVHGYLASAWINWGMAGVDAALARDHQVVALDMPGHGLSGKPVDEAAYGVQMAEDVIAVMDHLEIRKAHVVGYSMGGMIAMKLMTSHPDRVRSCVLGGMGWLKEGSAVQKVFLDAKPDLSVPTAPLALAFKGMGRLAVTADEVKAIKIPVIVLIGEKDSIKLVYVDPLTRIRPDWPVHVVPGAGHMNCIVKPAFKREIVDWIAEQK